MFDEIYMIVPHLVYHTITTKTKLNKTIKTKQNNQTSIKQIIVRNSSGLHFI